MAYTAATLTVDACKEMVENLSDSGAEARLKKQCNRVIRGVITAATLSSTIVVTHSLGIPSDKLHFLKQVAQTKSKGASLTGH